MLRNTIWRTTFLLFILTMMAFFIVQFLFKTDAYISISDYQFILATSISNAFVVTSIYAIVAAYNMMKRLHNPGNTFFKIFKLTFFPGVMAGALSIIAVFAYFHFIDPAGIEQIKTEYLDYSLVQAKENGEYDQVVDIVNSKEVRGTNLLSNKTFTLILGIMVFFNFSLALMLTFLWKIRTTPSKK